MKARSGAQQFQRDEYTASGMEAVVAAEFAERPDKSVKKVPIALKQRVAKEFFAKLPKGEQDAWVAKAKREAEEERARAQDMCVAQPVNNPAVIAT